MTSLFVYGGSDFDAWRRAKVFQDPGGGAGEPSWRSLDGDAHVAVWGDGAGEDAEQTRKRWRKAQRAEIEFWRGWREHALYRHVSLVDFWNEVIEKTGGPLQPGATLDVGCGPVSALNFCRPAGLRPIGVDPLAEAYAREGLLEAGDDMEAMPMVACQAERLPFVDGAFDQITCFNVLDHVADAPAVIREMRRALRPGGAARVYVHTFAAWIKRLLFFDRPHTYHWSHREFRRLVEGCGFETRHELQEPKSFDIPRGWRNKLVYFPYIVAGQVAATSYFQFQRSD